MTTHTLTDEEIKAVDAAYRSELAKYRKQYMEYVNADPDCSGQSEGGRVMKKTTRTSLNPCPHCGYKVDSASDINHASKS